MLGNAFELPTDISSVDFAAKQPLRALPLPSPLPHPLLICLIALSQDFWSGSSGSVLCSAAVGGSRSRGGQDGERFSFRRKLTSSACWLQKLLGCHGAAFCWHLQGPNFITRRTRGFLLNPQCCLGKSTQGSTGDRKLEVSVCVCVCVWAAVQLCKQFAGHQSQGISAFHVPRAHLLSSVVIQPCAYTQPRGNSDYSPRYKYLEC